MQLQCQVTQVAFLLLIQTSLWMVSSTNGFMPLMPPSAYHVHGGMHRLSGISSPSSNLGYTKASQKYHRSYRRVETWSKMQMESNEESDNEYNDDEEEITNHLSFNNTITSTDSQFFEDDDCYDLCEADDPDNFQPESSGNDSNSRIKNETPKTKHNQKSIDQVKGNLELRWDIDKNQDDCDVEDITSCSDPCDACHGTGLVECGFCHGVGWVDFGAPSPGTIGEKLAKSSSSGSSERLGVECPVCNDDGEVVCQKCMGSGWIARWRTKRNLTDLQP